MTHSLIRNKDTSFPTIQLQGIINTTKRGKALNNKCRLFWEDYWKEKSEKAPADAFVSAWAFGSDPDHLLDLVKQGKKQPLVLDTFFMKRNRSRFHNPDNMRSFWTAKKSQKPSLKLHM